MIDAKVEFELNFIIFIDSLDKCKSMLMGITFERNNPDAAKEKIEEIHKIWSMKIYLRPQGKNALGPY